LGLASRHRASCTLRRRKGDRSRLAAAKPGVRWRAVDDPAPRGGCASSIPEEGASPGGASRPAGERALVEGRRPGVGEAAVFDETAAEAVPGGFAGKVRPKGRIGSRGIATEGVRSYVASSARGRQRRSREVQRGGAFDRSSARTARHHAHRRLPGVTRKSARSGRVAARLKLEVRRQAKLHLGAHRKPLAEGGSAYEVALLSQGTPARVGSTAEHAPGNRAICGVLGSVVGCRSRSDASFSSRSSRHGATRGAASRSRDSLKRPAIL
jgi:hypothetical protein